jgi:hypothetical protein
MANIFLEKIDDRRGLQASRAGTLSASLEGLKEPIHGVILAVMSLRGLPPSFESLNVWAVQEEKLNHVAAIH